MTSIAFPTFATLFTDPVVRAWWDLDALDSAGATVTLRAVTDPDELASWYLPWYRDTAGQTVPFDHPAAVPLTVRQAACGDGALDRAASDVVTNLANQMRHAASFMAVTFKVGSSDAVLLDGCYRTVAAVRHELPLQVAQFELNAPVDPALIADATFWQRRGASR